MRKKSANLIEAKNYLLYEVEELKRSIREGHERMASSDFIDTKALGDLIAGAEDDLEFVKSLIRKIDSHI